MKINNQAIAFDFGSSNIKIVVASSRDEHIFIEKYVIIPTPEDAVFDGKIYHKTKIAEILKQFAKDFSIRKNSIMITISSGDSILRTFELPKMEEKELKEAVKFEMEHLLPNSIENYVVDYIISEEYEEELEEGDKVSRLKVQTAALPKSVVTTYLDTFEKAGLKIDTVDIQSNSIVKLFGGRKKLIKDFEDTETIDKNIAIIDLGNQKTTITIMEYGKVFLNRVIHKGGRDITRMIAETLDLNIDVAEDWKSSNNFLNEKINEEVYSALKYFMNDIMTEINKIIEYFISRSIQKKLDRIYLIGGGAKALDIASYFESYFNVVTILGNNYRNIKVNTEEKIFSCDLLYLCNVLGILLRKE